MGIGCGTGVAASLLTHPIDVVKVHWQMSTPFLPKLQLEGARLFYQGYSKTFTKTAIASLFFFPLYDWMKLQTGGPISAGIASAIISTTIMQPLDYLKTTHMYKEAKYHGFSVRPYFKGLSLNLLRIVPHFTIMMTTIDIVGNIINSQ
jgi:hypothetical protein